MFPDDVANHLVSSDRYRGVQLERGGGRDAADVDPSSPREHARHPPGDPRRPSQGPTHAVPQQHREGGRLGAVQRIRSDDQVGGRHERSVEREGMCRCQRHVRQ